MNILDWLEFKWKKILASLWQISIKREEKQSQIHAFPQDAFVRGSTRVAIQLQYGMLFGFVSRLISYALAN